MKVHNLNLLLISENKYLIMCEWECPNDVFIGNRVLHLKGTLENQVSSHPLEEILEFHLRDFVQIKSIMMCNSWFSGMEKL